MNINNLQSVDTWFPSLVLVDYFEQSFTKNTIGTFKAPASLVKRFNDFKTPADKEKCIKAILNIYIGLMSSLPQAKILRQVPFHWLEEDTQFELKQGAMEAVQHAVLNKQVWERINSSTYQSNSFSFSNDTTNWLLGSDAFGQIAKSSVLNSGIGDYEIVDPAPFYQTTNGNFKVIGNISEEVFKQLSL